MNPTLELGTAWEYEPAPELTRPEISTSYGLFIDGEFVESASGKMMKTISPSTEEVLTEVGVAGAEDVDRAVTAARAASVKWRARSSRVSPSGSSVGESWRRGASPLPSSLGSRSGRF